MYKPILFIHGGGDEGYETDQLIVDALQEELGSGYKIQYPKLESDESKPDFGWVKQIDNALKQAGEQVIVVAHSLGASMLLKCLSEVSAQRAIQGIFLLATPYWTGDEDWKQGMKLIPDFADKLDASTPLFLYHCRDDEEVPFEHLDVYTTQLRHATVRVLEHGGHQFEGAFKTVAEDIKSLS